MSKIADREGAEEMVSEIVSPYLKRLTYDKQADSATVESVVEAGLIGALTSLAYGGAQTAVKKVAGVNTVIPSELENVATYDEALKKGWDSNDKATVEKVSQAKAETLKTISQELANMSEDKRAKYIDKHNLGEMFNADGTLTDNYNNAYNGNMELARAYDTRYVSMGADSKSIESDLATINEDNAKRYAQINSVSIEEAREQVEKIKVYSGELGDKAKQDLATAKQAVEKLGSYGMRNLKLVVVDENQMFNGNYNGTDNNIYIAKDTLENGNWVGTLIHEVMHSVEKSGGDYNQLSAHLRFVLNEQGKLDDIINGVAKLYDIDGQVLLKAIEKQDNNEQLSQEEKNLIELFDSELNAKLAEEVLGNEDFINRIVKDKPNLAKRIVETIQNIIKVFKMNKVERRRYSQLLTAERLYLKAAYNTPERQALAKMIEQGIEENKQVQVDEQNAEVGVDQTLALQYNKNVQFQRKFSFLHKNFPGERESGGSEAHRLAIWWTRQPNIVAGDQTLISMNGRWYLVEKFDDADNGYQVEDYITKAEYNKIFEEIKQYGRSGKIESIQGSTYEIDKLNKRRNTIGREKSSLIGDETQYRRKDNSIQRVGEEESKKWQTSSDRSGDSESGDSSKQGIDYSLKDSQGNELTQQQAEYFRDSKVRDEQGNLLVVYHGSRNAGFTIFKTDLEGTYFTADKQYATEYAKMNNDNVYSVYLDIKKPFDTREKKARKIFEEQFYGQWGNGAPLTKRGLLDWTDGADMYDFLQEKGLDYDGIIVDEGGVPMPSGVKDRGISYVAFYPEQIKLTTNLNPTSNQDIRYSIKPFAEQVDDILGGKDTTSTHLKIMDTPQILQDVGLPKLPILMTARHLDTTVNESGKKGLNYHGLGIDIIKQLPNLIEKPALIAESLTRDDSVVLITQAIDKQRRPVIVAIKVNGVGRLENVVIQANVMTSAYGKDNFYNYIKKFIDNDKILFWDKKRSQRVSVNPGLQLSDVITNLASDTIIRKIDIKSQDFVSKNPTDIKQSRKSPAPSQVGDIIKAQGNLTTDKIFTKDEVKKIIANIEERLVFEDKGMVGTVKGTNELIDRLWKGLNKADKGEYTRVGVEIADYVINHTVVEDIYECLYSDTEVDEAREVIKTLKQYFHKVKISDRVLGEIKYHFDDKSSKVLSLWRAKEGGLA